MGYGADAEARRSRAGQAVAKATHFTPGFNIGRSAGELEKFDKKESSDG